MKFKSLTKISGFVLAMLLAVPVIAQETAQAVAQELPPADFFSINTDSLLMLFAVFLILPIYFLGKLALFSVKINIDKKTKVAGVLGLILVSASSANASAFSQFNYVTWMLIIIIMVELFVIGILTYHVTKLLNWFSGSTVTAGQAATAAPKRDWIGYIWQKMNSLRPIEDEGELDTGHVYDGIRELDNVAPPWFTYGFIATIIIAIVYLWVYHVSESAPLQIEEYNIEIAKAEVAHNEYLKTQASAVDENTVIFLTDAASIANGKKLYEVNCFACHKADGGGSVGPNLTDAYWIHGNTASDIFKVIKYGVLEKGMTPWADVFSPNQIAEVVSFVHSLQGTNPADAKEPQGELIQSDGAAATTEVVAADTVAM